MMRLKSCHEEKKKHLINYIIERRVLISDDCTSTYENIEALTYHFGSADTNLDKGECDASFYDKMVHE